MTVSQYLNEVEGLVETLESYGPRLAAAPPFVQADFNPKLDELSKDLQAFTGYSTTFLGQQIPETSFVSDQIRSDLVRFETRVSVFKQTFDQASIQAAAKTAVETAMATVIPAAPAATATKPAPPPVEAPLPAVKKPGLFTRYPWLPVAGIAGLAVGLLLKFRGRSGPASPSRRQPKPRRGKPKGKVRRKKIRRRAKRRAQRGSPGRPIYVRVRR